MYVDENILTEWVSEQLKKVGGVVGNLHTDIRDGWNLFLLLESLTGNHLSGKKSRLRNDMLQNVHTVLEVLKYHTANDIPAIDAENIVDGDKYSTLKLISIIMQHFEPLTHSSDRTTMANVAMENGVGRMKSLKPIALPYEDIDTVAEPSWNITTWSQPLLDAMTGDGKRMLLDAFVIYLGRLLNEDTLHIGWNIRETATTRKDGEFSDYTIPMTVTLSLNDPWSSVSENIDREIVILERHYRNPLNRKVDDITVENISAPKVKWRVVVSMASDCQTTCEVPICRGELLTLQIDQSGHFRWIHDASRLNYDVLDRMNRHLRELVASVSRADCGQTPIFKLNMLPEDEKKILLKDWTVKKKTSTVKFCLHQLFEKQVIRTPTSTALIYEDEMITYAELNARANRLAHRLIEIGVSLEQIIAICVSDSLTTVVCILAILKAGGACLILDLLYTSQRLIDIFDDASPNIVIADETGVATLREVDFSSIFIVNPHEFDIQSEMNPNVQGLTPQNLAYVLHTSGTTGQPKGVMMEHRNIGRVFSVTTSIYDLGHHDVWCSFHSLASALALWELWAPLYYGGKLVLVPRESARSPDEIERRIRKHGVTVLNRTPSAFRASLSRYGREVFAEHLRYVTFAGEVLSPSLLQPVYAKQAEKLPRFVNIYGASEIPHSIYRAWNVPETEQFANLIGTPFSDVSVYLLDPYGQPVPLGAVGEMYIQSPGVTRGYLNKPDLTAERFLQDPFSNTVNARMYRTGDLARYLPDGNLVFMGRNDRQVKIRGYRVEFSEVEAYLKRHYAVNDAVVVAFGDETDKHLVAYVIAEAFDDLAQEMYMHMTTQLPDYMIPSAFVSVDRFPLTPNGKLDIGALPLVEETSLVRGDYETPRGEVEISLARVWKKLLGLQWVSRNDSFFALGGHSLSAIQVVEHMGHSGFTLMVRDVFENPVLYNLARTVKAHESFTSPPNLITPGVETLTPDMLPLIDLTQTDIDHIISKVPGGITNIQDIYGLSPTQDGILFHHLLSTEEDPYLIMRQIVFRNHDNLQRYLAAFQGVIKRHDSLRTAFIWEGISTPAQVVWREASISITEFQSESNGATISEQLTSEFGRRRYRIDLNRAPLIRCVIACEIDDRWILQTISHHLIYDERTTSVLDAEILAFYNGKESELNNPNPYRDHIAQVRRGIGRELHVKFFTEMLDDIDEPISAFDLTGIHTQSSQILESSQDVAPELHEKLRIHSKTLEVTVATLCHLAWAIIIARASGKSQTVFGTVLFGRIQAGEVANNGVGLFVNALPVRLNIDRTPVNDCVHQTQKKLAQLMEHEHVSLIVAQSCSRIPNGTLLFNSLLNYRYGWRISDCLKEAREFEILRTQSLTNYPLTITIDDTGIGLTLIAQIQQPIDSSRVCDYMREALTNLADILELCPRKAICSVDFLPTAERKLLLETWNHTEVFETNTNCIHSMFEQQVLRSPSSMALTFNENNITYAQLNLYANQLAYRLIEAGVGPECLVGICTSVSSALLVSILAVLKAGGAYVPLDPNYPTQRLSDIIDDASLEFIIADEIGMNKSRAESYETIKVIDPNIDAVPSRSNPVIHNLRSDNLAYVIYTSGSTGKPKGVMVEHANVVRLFEATDSEFRFDHNDVWCLFHSFAFDVSVWEIWGTLCYGGRLVLMSRDEIRSPEATWNLLEKEQVTVLNETPSAFKASISTWIRRPALVNLRYVMFAGESIDPSILNQLHEVHDTAVPQFVVMYGPTEITVHAMYKILDREDMKYPSCCLGKRIPDVKVYLLDAHAQPVPLGAIGELYIGGAGVARSYLNRNDLNEKHYLRDPFAKSAHGRMYRTGDLARYSDDGKLWFMGRNDHQIKIRGFRIEPGEIEARLRMHVSVKDARVLTIGEDPNKLLIAYITAETLIDSGRELRSHMLKHLPDHMVPSAFVRLDKFPLTINGKLDTRALPIVDDKSFVHEKYEPPRGNVEVRLAEIWRNLLNLERVSRNDSFFSLGGNSLLAMKVIEAMRCEALTIAIKDLFQFPVLRDLAETVQDHVPLVIPPNHLTLESIELTPEMLPLIDLTQSDIDHIISKIPGGLSNIQDIYELSPLQDGILFHHRLSSSDPYLSMRLIAFTNREKLNKHLTAFENIINRHDILRTSFFWQGISTAVQVVWRHVQLPFTEVKLDRKQGPLYEQLISQFKPHRYRLNLNEAPLIRSIIARETDNRWILLTLIHHLIIDDKSMAIIENEITAHINQTHTMLNAPIPYRDHIARIRQSSSREMQIKFFTEMLHDIGEPSLPLGLTRKNGGDVKTETWYSEFPSEISTRLRHHSKVLEVSAATICHLAWALVVSHTSGMKHVVFGTVLSGRMQNSGDSVNAVGLFVNTLPVRLNIDETPVRDCVRFTYGRLAQLLEHEHTSLAIAQRCSCIANGTILFNSLFNYRNYPLKLNTWETSQEFEIICTESYTNYPLTVTIDNDDNCLTMKVQVIQPIDATRIYNYMQEAFTGVITALDEFPQKQICTIDILPSTEREMLLSTWNHTSNSDLDTICIHHFFERQVSKASSSAALICDGQTITYAELNTRSNQLAHQLIQLGVMPDCLVGICVAVSPAMLVGILAILKAGGAYVPLDPTDPEEQLVDIITDTSPKTIIADEIGLEKLRPIRLDSVIFIDPNNPLSQSVANPFVSQAGPHNLAYVIYTSGATGKPKGVMVEHRNIVRLFDATESHLNIKQNDVWCLSHSIASDFSVWEIWGAFRSGGRLIIMSRDEARSPLITYKFICEQSVNMLNQTASAFRSILTLFVDRGVPSRLRYVIIRGESLDPSILRPLYVRYKDALPKLYNMYGTTETTVHATHKLLEFQDTSHSTSAISTRLRDTKIYLLNRNGQPVPLRAIGEIYIGGPGVARGYINRPEQTTGSFLADPFSHATGARMFKTGDLARYSEEGDLIFIGRNNHWK